MANTIIEILSLKMFDVMVSFSTIGLRHVGTWWPLSSDATHFDFLPWMYFVIWYFVHVLPGVCLSIFSCAYSLFSFPVYLASSPSQHSHLSGVSFLCIGFLDCTACLLSFPYASPFPIVLLCQNLHHPVYGMHYPSTNIQTSNTDLLVNRQSSTNCGSSKFW